MCALDCSAVNSYGYGSYADYKRRTAQKNGNGSVFYSQYKELYKKQQKVGFWEGVKTFSKGLLKPIKNMIQHPFKTALGIGAVTALIIGTGGAATPLLIAAGFGLGGYQAGKGIYNFIKSDTRQETLAALEDMGEGSFTIAASAFGAKSYMAANAKAGTATAAASKETGLLAKTGTYIKGLAKDSWNVLKEIPGKSKETTEIITSGLFDKTKPNKFMANLKPTIDAYKLEHNDNYIKKLCTEGKVDTPEYNAAVAKSSELRKSLSKIGDGNVCKNMLDLKKNINPLANKAETNLAIGLTDNIPDDNEYLETAAMLYPQGLNFITGLA